MTEPPAALKSLGTEELVAVPWQCRGRFARIRVQYGIVDKLHGSATMQKAKSHDDSKFNGFIVHPVPLIV